MRPTNLSPTSPAPTAASSSHIPLDLSAGSQSYVEDCQVCCQPIQVAVQVAEDGSLEG